MSSENKPTPETTTPSPSDDKEIKSIKDLPEKNQPKTKAEGPQSEPKKKNKTVYFVTSKLARRFEVRTPYGTAIFLGKGTKPANKFFEDGVPEVIYLKYFAAQESKLEVTKKEN